MLGLVLLICEEGYNLSVRVESPVNVKCKKPVNEKKFVDTHK